MATWVVQPHAKEPEERPSLATVHDWLDLCVDDWGKSIVPLVPESWQDGVYHMSLNKHGILLMLALEQEAMQC